MAALLRLCNVSHGTNVSRLLRRSTEVAKHRDGCGNELRVELTAPARAALCDLLRSDYACGFAAPGEADVASPSSVGRARAAEAARRDDADGDGEGRPERSDASSSPDTSDAEDAGERGGVEEGTWDSS